MNKIKQIDKHLNIIKTRKYKDINIYLRFSIFADLKIKAITAILAKLIGEASTTYPNKVSMTRAKDMLYGANVVTGYKVRSNVLTFNVSFSFINPKFLNTNIDDYVNFVNEILHNTLINENNVAEVKRNLVARLERRLDKPQAYASEKVTSIISKNSKEYLIYDTSNKFIKEIKKVKTAEVKKLYDYLLNKALLDVYFCGDINEKFVKKFNFNLKHKDICIKQNKHLNSEQKNIIEKKDISQSTLIYIFKTPFNKKHKDYYAFVLGNIFLGVLPTSLLFEEVREKLGLCYAIDVIDEKNEGLVKIHTDINGKNKDIVINEINKQIKRLINIDYDLNKLEIAKTMFINILDSTYDDFSYLVDYDLECKLSKHDVSLNEYKNKIMHINASDISRVFKQYKPYFIYMLKGNCDE